MLTVMPPDCVVVQPVRVVAPTPVQLMMVEAVGVGFWVRSTNPPATSCSGEPAAPVCDTEIVAGVPP